MPRVFRNKLNFLKLVERRGVHPYDFFLMALTTNIPPQAYTRDTLVKAIEWVSGQPPTVRERANSADLVVSFYLQACRKAASTETPVSGASFKTDLRHLAQDLKKFDDPTSAPPPPGRLSAHDNLRTLPAKPTEEYFSPPEPIFKPAPQIRVEPQFRAEPKYQEQLRMEIPRFEATRSESSREQSNQGSQLPLMQQEPSLAQTLALNPAPVTDVVPKGSAWVMDSRSMDAAKVLQLRLNLSTEAEALRMLVTLGAEAAKKLFP